MADSSDLVVRSVTQLDPATYIIDTDAGSFRTNEMGDILEFNACSPERDNSCVQLSNPLQYDGSLYLAILNGVANRTIIGQLAPIVRPKSEPTS